jgi:hypothetical protein
MTWPGNVRELKNFVQRAYILATRSVEGVGRPGARARGRGPERLIVVRVGTPLERWSGASRWPRSESAARQAHGGSALGISLKTLYNRLEAYAAKDRAREAEETGPMPIAEAREHAASAEDPSDHWRRALTPFSVRRAGGHPRREDGNCCSSTPGAGRCSSPKCRRRRTQARARRRPARSV